MESITLDPAAFLLPNLVLAVIFAHLPRKEFHQCRCLSRAWATALSSDDLIDRHLSVRGKMRLGYDDLMKHLAFQCVVRSATRVEINSEGDGEILEQTEINAEADSEIDVEEQTPEVEGEKKDNDDDDEDDDGDDGEEEEEEEEVDWRQEYRIKGYVEVDKDYYIRRAERLAWLQEEWAKLDFSGLTIADSDDEQLKACTIPLGALPPHIRQPVLEEQEEDTSSDSLGGKGATQGCINSMLIRGRQKTEEEVDQEIIAFLRRCWAMDPKPQFLKEFDRYRWPPAEEEQDSDYAEELIGQGDDSDNSDGGEVDVQDSSADF